MNYNTVSRIATIGLIVSGVLLMASIAYLVMSFINYTPVAASEPIVRNMVIADPKERDGSVRYYNGNTFMQLSANSLKTTSITPELQFMSDVWAIHWIDSGAVVNFGTMPQNPALSQRLTSEVDRVAGSNRLVDSTALHNFYWYVNFADSSISYLTYTENPFEVSVGSDGRNIFFTDTPSDQDMSLIMSGQVTEKGEILRGIFGTVESGPHRVIHREGSDLYALREDEWQHISLVQYNFDTFNEKVIIEDVYKTMNHTIYEDVIVHDGSLYITNTTQSEDERAIEKVNLKTGDRQTKWTYIPSEDYDVRHVKGSTYQIKQIGENTLKVTDIDMSTGEETRSSALSAEFIHADLVYVENELFILQRPSIQLLSRRSSEVVAAYSGPLEDDYKSQHSTLLRDIFSIDGDQNRYNFVVASGKFSEEYVKLKSYVESKNLNIHDFTIIPEVGRNAEFDSI